MDFVYPVVVLLHFLGFASVFAGAMMSLRRAEPGLAPAVFHGAITQLVTGLALVTMLELDPDDPTVNHAKVGVKLALLVVVTVLAVVFRKREMPKWVAPTILALTVLIAAIAVLW